MNAGLVVLDADAVATALTWQEAIQALRRALADGLDPELLPARSAVDVPSGQLLVMPAVDAAWAGVKLVSIAPGNPEISLPRVQGIYALFDAMTLTPSAILDGAALTAVRTPAVSALGLDLVARADASRLVVFGTGPQAEGHVHAVSAIRPISQVSVVGRNPGRAEAFVGRLAAGGIDVALADPSAVAAADIVVCATTAARPLFDGALLPDQAVVLACGSHTPDAREVDAATVGRGQILVESKAAALAEAGDIILALDENACRAEDLVTMAELVRGHPARRPRLVKTVGMGWEDLVIAAAIVHRVAATTPPTRFDSGQLGGA